LVAIAGFALTYFFYGRAKDSDPLLAKAPRLFHVLERHGWFDDLYDWYVAKVQQRLCDVLAFFDQFFIRFICVQGSGAIAGLTGAALKRTQGGSLHAYVYWFLAGVVLFCAIATGFFN
jgi:NADH-quinone oxidoreductase subunit L